MNKHIWEGWTVNDFINELEPMFDMIMKGNSHVNPFKSRGEVSAWCMSNQPYYKKYISEVVNYFEQKRLEYDRNK